jgi:hypothetical protein
MGVWGSSGARVIAYRAGVGNGGGNAKVHWERRCR